MDSLMMNRPSCSVTKLAHEKTRRIVLERVLDGNNF